MRCPILFPAAVLALQAAPPAPLHVAATQLLEAYDSGAELPRPEVRRSDRPSLEWLRAALEDKTPSNPFPKGTREYREAEALLKLQAQDPAHAAFQALRPTLIGTQARLWNWGKQAVRLGHWSQAHRQAWENRMLLPDVHPTLRGWAIRHALCFALAEADEARLTSLREQHGEDLPGFFQTFQRAFGLLGGPAPRFDLWSVPDLKPVDPALSELGARIWVAPFELPPPFDAAWIIPASASDLPVYASRLDGESLAEAVRTADQFRAAFRTGHFAASRAPWEERALAYFPIEIRFDESKRVKSIRMGDAAQARPTP